MPGFNQQLINAKVASANETAILVGDQPIAFGQTAGVSLGYGAEELYGVGNAKPQEIQQFKFNIGVTLSALKMTQAGLNAVGQNAPWLKVLTNTELTFHLVDDKGNSIMTIIGCTAGSYSSNIPANQPITEDISFMALDILDENGDSYLDSGGAAIFNSLAASGVNFIQNLGS